MRNKWLKKLRLLFFVFPLGGGPLFCIKQNLSVKTQINRTNYNTLDHSCQCLMTFLWTVRLSQDYI